MNNNQPKPTSPFRWPLSNLHSAFGACLALLLVSHTASQNWLIAVLTTISGVGCFLLVRDSYRHAKIFPTYRFWRVLVAIALMLVPLYLMGFVVMVTADPSMGNPLGSYDVADATLRWARMSHVWHLILLQAIQVAVGTIQATFTTSTGVTEFLWMVRVFRVAAFILIEAAALHGVGFIHRARLHRHQ